MKMRSLKTIFVILALGIALVFGMVFYSKKEKSAKNGFNRIFNQTGLTIKSQIDVVYDSYYISDMYENNILLGNYNSPLHLLIVSQDLKDSVHESIKVNSDSKMAWNKVRIQNDSDKLYLLERYTPSLMSVSMKNQNISDVKLGRLNFDMAKILSAQSMVIKYFSNEIDRVVLQKILISDTSTKNKIYKLGYQPNGDFSSDGFLSYDRKSGKILYTCYYSNQMTLLDTSLNLIYSANTIDTNSTAKIQVAEITQSGGRVRALSAPPSFVNKRGFLNDQWIYINSALASDTEASAEFRNYSVIDIYRISDGQYFNSIRVPNFSGKRISDFLIHKNLMYTLHGHHLVSYIIN